jgi:hypothetical protein
LEILLAGAVGFVVPGGFVMSTESDPRKKLPWERPPIPLRKETSQKKERSMIVVDISYRKEELGEEIK